MTPGCSRKDDSDIDEYGLGAQGEPEGLPGGGSGGREQVGEEEETMSMEEEPEKSFRKHLLSESVKDDGTHGTNGSQ